MRDGTTLLIAVAVLVVACVGKGVACWGAARWNGETPRAAAAVGALMNARGLMELILLNMGLERGLIGSSLFSVMVLMAVVTTLLASPLFEWAYGRHARRTGQMGALEDAPGRAGAQESRTPEEEAPRAARVRPRRAPGPR